jgi:two-component system, sensor histidine kinase and response regulator
MTHRILVIDDEPTVRGMVARILKKGGYVPVEAEDGEEGVSLARKEPPALILCDVLMPRQDGYGTLERLQADASTSAIPFIFMTGKGELGDVRKGMNFGADDYLTKPFTRQQLLDAVATRLERRAKIEQASRERMDELRGKIMYVLPHELRTPLTAILGLAELLVCDAEAMEADRVADVAQGILDSGERLSRIIENYLIYSQIELIASDSQRLEDLRGHVTTTVSVDIVEAAGAAARNAGREEDLAVTAEESSAVAVSDDNLRKLIGELTDNACKFSPPGAAVTVTGKHGVGGRYDVQISDHGRGMSEDEVAGIGAYSQFRRDTFEQPGTGLGLVIAKRLAEVHGASFEVISRPGEGTTVAVGFALP